MNTHLMILAFAAILAVVIPLQAYSYDISNQVLTGESATGDIIYIEFSDNTERKLMSKTIVTPNTQFIYVESTNNTLELSETDADFETFVSEGGTIRILSRDGGFILYAHHLGENNYKINFYSNFVEKNTYSAILE